MQLATASSAKARRRCSRWCCHSRSATAVPPPPPRRPYPPATFLRRRAAAQVCDECGKPCRSETEKSLHTTRTGHSRFSDKTAEAAKPIDSEAQMAALKAEAMEVDGGAGSRAGVAAGGEGGGGGEEMVAPDVDGEMVLALAEMGFSRARATRALYATGSNQLETCVNWLVEHGEDADIDEPLLVAKASLKAARPKLSKEEARAQAEALRKSGKEKREKEEREREKLRELERIRAGKEMQAARKIEEDQERRRIIDTRRREKEEEARAKERIRVKLAEDKAERRRKLGLPEEPTPEELAAEEARSAAKAAAEAAEREKKRAAGLVVKPVSLAENLRAALVEMKKAHGGEGDRFAVACKTLLTYVGNIAGAPAEEKFRKIRISNAAFQQRVGGLAGGLRFLRELGFEDEPTGEFLVLPADKAGALFMNAAGAEINSALTNPFFGVL